MNPHMLEKIIRVCNAGAKYKSESLNEKLLTGPDLLRILVEIFSRSREHKNAWTADIEVISLQVKVQPESFWVLRLLWRFKLDNNDGVYEHTRHLFCAKSSPTWANLREPTMLSFKPAWITRTVTPSRRSHEKEFYYQFFCQIGCHCGRSKVQIDETRWIWDRSTCWNGFVTPNWWLKEFFTDPAESKTFEVKPHTSPLLSVKWTVDFDTLEVIGWQRRTYQESPISSVFLSAICIQTIVIICIFYYNVFHPTDNNLCQNGQKRNKKLLSEKKGI